VPLQPYDDYDEEIESPEWLEDPGESPEENLVRSELSAAIQNCLDDLENDFRVVVVLVDIQGMDYAEAAAVIESPLGTIKSRLARARTRLQDCLHGFGELLPDTFRFEGESIP
jgi:RNA polymerase sigma-70 factor, ECF subfamily